MHMQLSLGGQRWAEQKSSRTDRGDSNVVEDSLNGGSQYGLKTLSPAGIYVQQFTIAICDE